ncbi:MAG: DegV family protein [Clostridia bacterium]|nr:DegV family protein [Clostridia bacterium]
MLDAIFLIVEIDNFLCYNVFNFKSSEEKVLSKKVLITRDSTSDLPAEIIEKYNIKTVPLGITLGDKTYRDGVDINPDFIYEYHKEHGILPKTSAANIAEMVDFFAPLAEEGNAIVHFTISSKMSSTYQNSLIAAEDFEDIYVVDTANLSTGEALLIMKAAELAEEGKSAKEIYDEITSLVNFVDASFVIDNLEYLHKGGRCSALAALGANLLKLKPCIQVKDGSMGVCKKYRGRFMQTLEEYVNDRLGDYSDIDLDRVFVTHAGCDEEIVTGVVNLVKEAAPFKEVIVSRAGCTISSHCGKDTLGVLFIRKSPLQ